MMKQTLLLLTTLLLGSLTVPDPKAAEWNPPAAKPNAKRKAKAERPEEVARLTKLLDQIITNGRSTPGAKQANDAEIQIRKGRGDAPKKRQRPRISPNQLVQ